MRFLIAILLCSPLFFYSLPRLIAQELPPPQVPVPVTDQQIDSQQQQPDAQQSQTEESVKNEITAEEFLSDPDLPFTGTLAEDDPENLEIMERELELFGEEDEDFEEEYVEPETGSHLIKFEFISRVQFVNHEITPEGLTITGEPYMEIEYKTHFEMPTTIADKRKRENIEAEYEIQNWGSLAKNEFFDCRLDIAMQEMPVEIITRLQKIGGEEDPDATTNLALKIKFSKDSQEDWFSFCTDITGAKLNTQGDTEDYNYQAIRLIEPSLRALVVEDYNIADQTKIDLNVPPKTINDYEISNDIIISGDGEITVEPI